MDRLSRVAMLPSTVESDRGEVVVEGGGVDSGRSAVVAQLDIVSANKPPTTRVLHLTMLLSTVATILLGRTSQPEKAMR